MGGCARSLPHGKQRGKDSDCSPKMAWKTNLTVLGKRSCNINWEADKVQIKLGRDKIKETSQMYWENR